MTIEYGPVPGGSTTGRRSEATPWQRELVAKLQPGDEVGGKLPKKYFTRSAASSVARNINKGKSVWADGGPWKAMVRREDNCWRVHVVRLARDVVVGEVTA